MKNPDNELNLSNFPEEIDTIYGIKVYGATSYENQIAVLSQYIHNGNLGISREEIVATILSFLEHKKEINPNIGIEDTIEYASMVISKGLTA